MKCAQRAGSVSFIHRFNNLENKSGDYVLWLGTLKDTSKGTLWAGAAPLAAAGAAAAATRSQARPTFPI